MADDLSEHFSDASGTLPDDVRAELDNIIALHSISSQELFYKWESYCIKMGPETQLDLARVRDFKKDLGEQLERENRGRAAQHARQADRKQTTGATPRGAGTGGDVFGMMDGLISNTPRPGALGSASGVGSTVKRKSNFETPASKANKSHLNSSPSDQNLSIKPNGVGNAPVASFSSRQNAGQVTESINAHISLPDAPEGDQKEPRIKLKANSEMSKFAYKTMAMKLSEASEILDDRIEEFIGLIRSHHSLDESAFGNPAAQSTSEIVAVGRIASDTGEGRLNAASLVLETSRRSGSGFRIPLRVDGLSSYSFFPGKIVALRGSNASGEFFTVSEMLDVPLLPPAATAPADLDAHISRLHGKGSSNGADPDTMDEESPPEPRPLSIMVAAGPYTPQASLDFSAFDQLLSTAEKSKADGLILLGPFINVEHPDIRNGTFELPSDFPVHPDRATANDVFRHHIAGPLARLSAAVPSMQIVLVPDTRDAVSHGAVAWPQERFAKKDVGLGGQRQIHCVSNPVTLSLNEAVWGFSSLDVVQQIQSAECVAGKAKVQNVFERACKGIVGQRHFMPVFPPADTALLDKKPGPDSTDTDTDEVEWRTMGAVLDVSYLKLGEWLSVRPDILVTPSALTPFAKVVESVLCINPGTLSKRKAPGTYARLTVLPPTMTSEEREAPLVAHRLFDRARVDIVRI